MATAYESELELEEELAGLGEFEQHEGEQHEWEQHELEQHELAGELEADQFFGRAFRGIRRFVQRAAPLLRQVARVAAPMVGTAIGGPFGAVLGRVASQALGEEELAQEWEQHELESPELAQEFEQHELVHEWEQHELEHELENPELTHEFEQHESVQHESGHEVAFEIAHHEVTQHEALAEIMAEAASHEQNEAQAEAMMGAAVVTVLSPRDRRALRKILPHMVRGTAILTRILRRRRITKPAVRVVPTIVRRAVKDLKRQAAKGIPITRKTAARAAAKQVRKVLGSPRACAAAITRNVKVSRAYRRPRRRMRGSFQRRRRSAVR